MSSPTPNKIIIIGASSGIGKELANLYLSRGNLVGVSGRRKELLDEFRSAFPATVFIEPWDLRGPDNFIHLETLIERLGGLDLLIYNAGFGEPSPSLEWELDRKTYETNVKGFIEIMNYAFNYFKKQGHGHLAAITSIAANRGNSFAPAYSASKAFQSIYLEGLNMKARRMKQHIVVTDIQPGFVNTKIARGNKLFWMAPVKKAASQIIAAIDKKKSKAYITKRWWIVSVMMKWSPDWLYHKIG